MYKPSEKCAAIASLNCSYMTCRMRWCICHLLCVGTYQKCGLKGKKVGWKNKKCGMKWTHWWTASRTKRSHGIVDKRWVDCIWMGHIWFCGWFFLYWFQTMMNLTKMAVLMSLLIIIIVGFVQRRFREKSHQQRCTAVTCKILS